MKKILFLTLVFSIIPTFENLAISSKWQPIVPEFEQPQPQQEPLQPPQDVAAQVQIAANEIQIAANNAQLVQIHAQIAQDQQNAQRVRDRFRFYVKALKIGSAICATTGALIVLHEIRNREEGWNVITSIGAGLFTIGGIGFAIGTRHGREINQ